MIKNIWIKIELERVIEIREDYIENEIMKSLMKKKKIICLKLY